MSEFLVVTGMSGAGRSTAAAALEDLGWFVIDNLPAGLIMKMVEMIDLPGAGDRARGPGHRPGRQQHGLGVLRRPARRARRAARPPATGCASSSSTRPTTCWCGATRARGAGTRWPPAGWRSRSPTSAAAGAGARPGRSPHRHRGAELEPAALAHPRGLRRREAAAHADVGGLVRLQVRHPARRGRRLRLPFPPQPVLGRGAAALQRPRRARCATTSWASPRRRTSSRRSTISSPASSRRSSREGKSYLTIAMGCTGGRHRSVALAEALATGWRARPPGVGVPPGRGPVSPPPGDRPRRGGPRRGARHRRHLAGRPPLRRPAHRGGLGGRRRRVERPAARAAQRGRAGRPAQVPGGPGRRGLGPGHWPSSTASTRGSWRATPWAT
jgi:hypothetical protein